MKAIKKFTSFAAIAAVLSVGCTEYEEADLDMMSGSVTFEHEVAEMDRIILKEARQQQRIKTDGKAWATIQAIDLETKEVGVTVFDDYLPESNSVSLAPGSYITHMKLITQSGEYAGEVEAESQTLDDDAFTVTAGQNIPVKVELYPNYIAVVVQTDGLPGAQIWAGPEGFVPSDEYLQTEGTVQFYAPDGAFEVVISYEGQTKRYYSTCSKGNMYFVFITNTPKQGTSTGSSSYAYEFVWGDNAKAPIEFSW